MARARSASVHPLALPALLLGATAIGLAPIFVRISDVGPITTAFYRLFLALPVLGLWWWFERGKRAPSFDASTWRWLFVAGLCFAGDLSVWHWSILTTSVANAT